MGLDMYLSKKVYIGANYEHRKVTGRINIKQDGKPIKINFKKVSSIEESVGYWRKANHIHQWFVEHVQKGEDDCGQYYVSIENLEKLLNACVQVKTDHSMANVLLPTKEGFFFGSTDYDEYYYRDIDDTIKILKNILKHKNEKGYIDNSEFYYESSW